MRGGFALYSVPFYIDAVNQVGFSQSTLLVPTLNAGLSFNANLANPFPGGVLEPTGASSGLATSLGQAVNTCAHRAPEPPAPGATPSACSASCRAAR